VPVVFTLSAGTHQLVVRGREANTRLGTITITQVQLPLPWQRSDIGTIGLAGGATATGDDLIMADAGNISGTADNFRFLYQPLSADGEIRACISSTSPTNVFAGAMIRETLAEGAEYAFMGISPSGSFRWQGRSATASSTSSTNWGIAAPPNAWVRLVRTGSTLFGYGSADGTNWTQVTGGSITMATNVYVGLAVGSGASNTLSTVTFHDVIVVP
jgi:hypothetical protein